MRRLVYVRDLLRELVVRDMKLRYKRSVLGIAWSLLNPLAQILVFLFIFGVVLKVNVPNYPSFLFIGVLAWNWFQSSLLLATEAVVDNRELIKRPGFPPAVLPVVRVTSDLIHFLLALPVLLVFLIFQGGGITSAMMALPLVIAFQFILALGLAYLASTFQVVFWDTKYLLGVALQLLFFLTPVFYDSSLIPERYRWVYRLNPMGQLIDSYRAILIRGELPNDPILLVAIVVAILLLLFGYLNFVRASVYFVEEL
jgi:lipopolysaccharide transport system permease protein